MHPAVGIGGAGLLAHPAPAATTAASASPARTLVVARALYGAGAGRPVLILVFRIVVAARPAFGRLGPRTALAAPAAFVVPAAPPPPPPPPPRAVAFALLGLAARGALAPRRGDRLFILFLLVDIVVVDQGLDHRLDSGVLGRLVRFALFAGGALDLVLGAAQLVVHGDGHAQTVGLFEPAEVAALFVQHIEGDGRRQVDDRRSGPAARRLDLDRPQRGQRRRLDRAHPALALAVLADVGRAFQHPHAAALAADLHQAEGRDLAHLHPGAVVRQAVLQLLLDRPVVLRLVHVDEVDDDQAGEVAQAQLAGGLLRRLHVGFERGRLDVALARGLARVDVDGDQGLGLVDDQIAAGLQLHDRRVDLRQLVLDLVFDEEGRLLLVELNLLRLAGHDHAHEVAGFAVTRLALDHDAVQVLVEHVPDGPFDEVFLLVDQGRRDRLQRRLADRLPQAHQVFVVALDLELGARGAGRADDQPHALRHVQALGGRLQPLAVGGDRDLAADAAAASGVGHQHAIAAGQRQVGGQGRALVAPLFLDDLHQHDLPALDHFLDLVAAHQPAATALQLLLDHIVIVVGGAVLVVAGAVRVVVVLLVLRLFAHQGFAVGDGDLVVVGMDFVESQEAVTVAAVFDERRLQTRFDPGHLG